MLGLGRQQVWGVWSVLLLVAQPGLCLEPAAAATAPDTVRLSGHRGELGQPFAAVHDAGATGTRPAAPARLLQAKQQQQIPEQARSPAAAESTSKTSSHSRHLQQQLGPVYADVPGDVLDLNSILAAARDAFTVFEPSLLPPQYGRPRYVPRAASHALTGFNGRNLAGGGANLAVTFRASHPDVELRLPGLPRSFNLTVSDASGTQQACKHTNRAYADQDLVCGGLQPGVNWLATLVDADSDDLVLATVNFTVESNSDRQEIPVEMGLLAVEAPFDKLAWGGVRYPRPRRTTTTTMIHAIIVGAQVVVYTRQGGKDAVWDTQWTSSEGIALFFLVPGVRNVYWANVSVADTVLRSAPITLDEPLSVYKGATPDVDVQAVQQLQQLQLTAAPQLLCTGEVEDVRGDAGTFPQSLAPLEASKQSIYHPRGFTCRWELTPDQPDVLLSVDYRGLLPDESVTLELAPNNVIRLNPPSDGSPGAVFQASIWVEGSILVSFQTTRSSTSKVGAFSISWTSVSSGGSKSVLDGKTMVVVLSCVSAAGAVLAACCFYFVCCGRRRRAGGVVVSGQEGGPGGQLVRVPSAVRSLLPSKPYQAPEPNPLPGASVEPDCCSICLVELEQGELVTVLPCMHFYHKDCIGSWLKRNCTCPLCKSNVLEAFKVQQFEARHGRRSSRRTLTARAAAANGSSSPSSSSNGTAEQQQIELAAVQPVAAEVGSRSQSPWARLEGLRSPSPAATVLPGDTTAAAAAPMPGDAVVTLSMLPAGMRASRLPPLQVQQQQPSINGSWLLSLTPAAAPAAAAAAVMGAGVPGLQPLIIPPSPSLSMVSLQSGSVLATPEDFAPAAAAAAAHAASTARHSAGSCQRSTSPTALADAAVSAAQVPVAALHSSSRTLGRRIQGLLSPSAASAAAAAPEASSPAGPAAAPAAERSGSGSARAGSWSEASRAGRVPSSGARPAAAAAAGPRVAVSIYAYAGHPVSDEAETEQHLELQLQRQQSGEISRSRSFQAITVLNLPGAVVDAREAQQQQGQPSQQQQPQQPQQQQ